MYIQCLLFLSNFNPLEFSQQISVKPPKYRILRKCIHQEQSGSTWIEEQMKRHDIAKQSFKTLQTHLKAMYLPPIRTFNILRLVKDRMGLKAVSLYNSV